MTLNVNLLIQLFGLSMLIGLSTQLSTNQSTTYIAGVVEYLVNQGSSSATSEEAFKKNADKYIEIMNNASTSNVDIIVFPESCLNSRSAAVLVPTESDDIDLCTNTTYNENLRNIACAAKALKMYVVINLTMKRNCTEVHEAEHGHDGHDHDEHECPNDWLLYNTDVVLNRDGKVISIYRKYNLFGETGITQPESVDMSTFTTDFGVTFGHFICFDLMFKEPALNLVANGIRDIVFPTMWFSELPFLSAVQIQQNWAYSNDVNFLGAGANNPTVGSSGSGIYSGKSGALISTMTGEKTTRLLVHEVPKTPGSVAATVSAYSGSNFDNFKLKRDQLDVYSFKDIKVPDSVGASSTDSFTLCHNEDDKELCCTFETEVILQSNTSAWIPYEYKAAVFNGNRTFDGVADGNMTACAILACKNDNITSCGIRYKDSETTDGAVESKYSFVKIVIKGNFPKENVFTLPNSLNFNVSPYPVTDFTYMEATNEKSSTKEITISLITPKSDLFTFAIYGRDFRSSSSSSSSNRIVSTIILLTAFVFTLFV